MKEPRIFLFWAAVSQGASWYLTSRHGEQRGARLAMAACSFIWAGSLVAISMTEAWTKFRSKILERQVGLDVGRLVFDALNTLELAFCLTILSLLFRYEPVQREDIWASPLVMSIILMLQVLYLTPRLELRAFHIACEELAKKKHATRADEAAFKEYKALTTLNPKPSVYLHHIYVVLEVIKLGILCKSGEILLTAT